MQRAFLFLLAGGLFCYAGISAFCQQPVDYANPLVGTAPLDRPELIGNAPPPGKELFTGFIQPGPSLPHRAVSLSPVNKDTAALLYPGLNSAYAYPRHTMTGFSSMISGMTIMPVTGVWTVPPDRNQSAYDKSSEHAEPGYYTVDFPDYKVKTELTTAEHFGLGRFTFRDTDVGTVVLDLGPAETSLEVVGDHELRGEGAAAGGNSRSGRYFEVEFSRPFGTFGTFHQKPPVLEGGQLRLTPVVQPDARTQSGFFTGCYLNFSNANTEPVLFKVVAGTSYDQAAGHLKTGNPGWDFDAVKSAARQTWNQALSRIEVEGGTKAERTMFYSTFLHVYSSPRLRTPRGESFTDEDGQTRVADYDRYTTVPFWDTGRNQIVLLMMLEPDLMTNLLLNHFEMARESGWMDTAFHGDHASLMYLGAWERGIPFDYAAVYPYLRKNATDTAGPRHYLAEYLAQGWIHDDIVPNPSPGNATPYYQGGRAGVATTLEYAWDDYALAMMAKKLGQEEDYKMFLARSHNYTNVFDVSIGFMRGRTEDGAWISPFDPAEPYYNFMMKEANGWQTLWIVPQDVPGLIDLLGGRDAFCQKLDEFFSTPYHPKGIERDDTGMLGQYCQGDQPDVHCVYYYDYAGQPWKTQALVRKILHLFYGSDRAGLAYPGMDDQGSTSSWYVFSALGFYPVNPATPYYIIGTPLFDKATVHLGTGKDLVIIAKHNSEANIYVQSATLNGAPLNHPWFSHSDIANGGTLVFKMGSQPNENWGSAPGDVPPGIDSNP